MRHHTDVRLEVTRRDGSHALERPRPRVDDGCAKRLVYERWRARQVMRDLLLPHDDGGVERGGGVARRVCHHRFERWEKAALAHRDQYGSHQGNLVVVELHLHFGLVVQRRHALQQLRHLVCVVVIGRWRGARGALRLGQHTQCGAPADVRRDVLLAVEEAEAVVLQQWLPCGRGRGCVERARRVPRGVAKRAAVGGAWRAVLVYIAVRVPAVAGGVAQHLQRQCLPHDRGVVPRPRHGPLHACRMRLWFEERPLRHTLREARVKAGQQVEAKRRGGGAHAGGSAEQGRLGRGAEVLHSGDHAGDPRDGAVHDARRERRQEGPRQRQCVVPAGRVRRHAVPDERVNERRVADGQRRLLCRDRRDERSQQGLVGAVKGALRLNMGGRALHALLHPASRQQQQHQQQQPRRRQTRGWRNSVQTDATARLGERRHACWLRKCAGQRPLCTHSRRWQGVCQAV
eukprot:365709-Chlamydomonas_euryale.AAC.3